MSISSTMKFEPFAAAPALLRGVGRIALAVGAALCCAAIVTLGGISAVVGGAVVLGGLALLLRRNDVLLGVSFVGVAIVADWYELIPPVRAPVMAPVLAAGLVLLLVRKREARAGVPRLMVILWLLLALLAVPALQRSLFATDGDLYFAQVLVTPAIFYLLGTMLATDVRVLRTILQGLALLGALIALHTVIASFTGIFLFSTNRNEAYLQSVSNFQVPGSATSRAGSFLGNPDWNGTFMALMVFLPIGLFLESRNGYARALYAAEAALILVALLYTFSTAAWIAGIAGLVVFLALGGRARERLRSLLIFAVGVGMIAWVFPGTVQLLLQHATQPGALTLREGAWQTALTIIRARPFDGLGLGLQSYLHRAEVFRSPAQYRPLAHPHNAYLELAALAGIQVLAVFLTLLGLSLWRAFRTYRALPPETRPLVAAVLAAVVVLSVNSLAINGWTLAPIAAVVWLALGAASSPALARAVAEQASAQRDDVLPALEMAARPSLPVWGTDL